MNHTLEEDHILMQAAIIYELDWQVVGCPA